LQVFDTERNQDKILDKPGHNRSYGHNESNRHPHPEGSLHLLGDPEERTDTKETRQHEVVDENGTDENDKKFSHTYTYPKIGQTSGYKSTVYRKSNLKKLEFFSLHQNSCQWLKVIRIG
jgi:hypothetical protein